MSRKFNAWGLAALLVALVVALGCADSEQEQAAAADAERQQAWAALQEEKAELDAAREELAELRIELATQEEAADAEDADTDAEGGEGEAVEDPQTRLNQLESQVQTQTDEFYSSLVEFLNAEPLVEGEEPSEVQLAALRMKSSEDMLVAEEYIVKGGNYGRAIDIYNSALLVDPDNEELQAALAEAQAKRYMSEERFAAVDDGMTEQEVRDLLGTPFHANVRNFPDDGVMAWFYPVDPQGSAAAVWFRERGGEMKVYKSNYEEVVKEGPTEVGGEAAGDEAEAG